MNADNEQRSLEEWNAIASWLETRLQLDYGKEFQFESWDHANVEN